MLTIYSVPDSSSAIVSSEIKYSEEVRCTAITNAMKNIYMILHCHITCLNNLIFNTYYEKNKTKRVIKKRDCVFVNINTIYLIYVTQQQRFLENLKVIYYKNVM